MCAEYNYTVQEKSLTQGFLTKYFWEPIVSKIPNKIKPNSITVFGAIFILISIFFVWLGLRGYNVGFAIAAFCIFVYMTCDNVDGPHARKTKQSSRLGEFLDHWFDAIDSVIMNMCILAMLNFSGWLAIVCMALVAIAFFATIWEHYHTGIFHSGKIGSNEALLLIIAIYFSMTFFYGNPLFKFQDYKTINFASVILYLTGFGCLFTIIGILLRVRKNFLEFAPILLIIFAVIAWFYNGLLTDNHTVFFILIANLFFCGRFLLMRLAQIQLPKRIQIIYIIGIISLILPWLNPWIDSYYYLIYQLFVLGLLGLSLFIDIILALKHLGTSQKI